MYFLVIFTVEKLNGVSAATIEFDRSRELAKRTEMFNLLKKCFVIVIVIVIVSSFLSELFFSADFDCF
jgi:hypothetical protein